MPVAKLICPECKKVLRPTKPLPEGKKVKCPKCGTLFAAAEPPPEEPAPSKARPAGGKAKPDRPAAAKAARGGAAKAKAEAPAKPGPKKAEDDDDDGGGTYGLFGGAAPEEEDEEGKPRVNYALDESIKDLRGPAQERVTGPSNWLLRVGMAGVIGWLGLIVVTLIPVVFPIKDPGGEENARPARNFGKGLTGVSEPGGGFPGANPGKEVKEAEDKENERSPLSYFHYELDEQALIIIPVCVVGFVYAALVTFGAVKVQNLESRGWGIAGSILALIPFNVLGLQVLVGMGVAVILDMMLDNPPDYYSFLIMQVLSLGSITAGVLNLMVLFNEDVIAGFEYVAE
jgi:hypothetical protein